MIQGQSVLGVVPARGGSKGIPRKNLYPIGSTPLTGFAIAAGLGVPEIDRLVLSTDDEEIASVGRAAGAHVPGLRPLELAGDATPMIDVLADLLASLRAGGETYDIVCLLQPTTPFRDPGVISQALQRLVAHPEATSCLALAEVTDFHPKRIRRIVDGFVTGYLGDDADREREQRQAHASDKAYRRCGAFYLIRTSTIVDQQSVFGDRPLPYIVDGCQTVTIDEPLDLVLAEAVWARRAQYPELAYLDEALGR